MSQAHDELLQRLREAATLSAVTATLAWDQETMMPERGGELRAEELALLARLQHERITDPRIGELVARCEAEPALRADPIALANLREIRRDHERAIRLPAELVAEISETGSRAMEVWKRARAESDFASFRPWLEKQVELNRRKAACHGAPEGGELYDALIEDYEPGMTGAEIERIFGPLRAALRPLIEAVATSGARPGRTPLDVPIDRQREFCAWMLAQVGFDLAAGRLDVSTHPFSIGIGAGDTRITTRYRADGFLDTVGSTLHEAGHGMYEQGLPKAERPGQPLAEPVGLGVHESQSRLWENHVGRSLEFWEFALPAAQRICGPALDGFAPGDLFGAMNRVEPHLIRVESDEATYHLHVMLRFDLERAMIRGDLAPADLPGAWNERIRDDLGLAVPDDRRGCLQDVHWSMGSIGYFPTYTLGSLLAAQLWEAASSELGDLPRQVARGEFAGLLSWLRRSVHEHGRRYPARDLCQRVTGRTLGHDALIAHLRTKLGVLDDRAGRAR